MSRLRLREALFPPRAPESDRLSGESVFYAVEITWRELWEKSKGPNRGVNAPGNGNGNTKKCLFMARWNGGLPSATALPPFCSAKQTGPRVPPSVRAMEDTLKISLPAREFTPSRLARQKIALQKVIFVPNLNRWSIRRLLGNLPPFHPCLSAERSPRIVPCGTSPPYGHTPRKSKYWKPFLPSYQCTRNWS